MRDVTPADFAHHTSLDTRWMDNDAYGHVNNVVFYSFFDTVINRWLIERGVLAIETSAAIGLVVETKCEYFGALAFPDRVTAGLRVAHIGTSSVRYEIALFRESDTTAAAAGHFVHVYVDRVTRRPVPIPDSVRQVLVTLRIG